MASNTSKHLFTKTPTLIDVVDTSDLFCVHRIYCVGQNYRKHVLEMGGDPDRESPFFFSKPADSISRQPQIKYPSLTNNLHHEVECVVALGSGGRDITTDEANAHIFGYAVGVDLTRRDLQAEAKTKGRPWDVAKGFDQSAPISSIIKAKSFTTSICQISLSVNNETRQQGYLEQMIWNIPELISELSRYYELQAGDLIFTGTPDGVGQVLPGDVIECQLGKQLHHQFEMIA
ncbi:MAG: fumarylacetoacetate hydrolase family protein [Gammaproteobacteria bacterium]|nr:fumarylacetoacetate hydrolase family protein [Gammaproteobacteria bacterium]NNJ72472.1 fumarylacetoacetate hydrolase family protein [Enterobacterales bacterium]